MTTKDVIFAGAGFIVGYLLVGYLKNSKNKSDANDLEEPIVDQAETDSRE